MLESLRSLSDGQLLTSTDAIAAQDRQITLKLLVRLCEIERRKLYLKLGYSSMFVYCRSRLRLSEGSAMRRIKTSRCLSRFPGLYDLLESGEVNLMSVALISRILNPGNAESLIERIRGKSKRDVEAILAEHEPRALIPPDRVRTIMVATTAVTAVPPCTATGDGKKSSSDQGANPMPALERHSTIQFTAREEFMSKVERARGLVWHQFPSATFEQLFELGLDELIARRDPEQRQKRREQKKRAPGKACAKTGKRYIPAAMRDQVFVRDGFRCSYVGPDGRRCTATVALQVDHVRPVARGGASTAGNLRILCAEHNRLEAVRLMGPTGLPQVVRERRPVYVRATVRPAGPPRPSISATVGSPPESC